jgi:DNA-binding transcriptional LysR family regulator
MHSLHDRIHLVNGMALQLAAFDLNLLLVFDAVMETRNVTRAADKLGLSQPALSHALNRLRWRLKDQLFVRTNAGMSPTPRAELLAEPIRRILADLQRALVTEVFAPEAADRAFAIAVNNYAALVLAAPVFSACRVHAPQVRLNFRPSGTLDVVELLNRGELDLAVLGQAPAAGRLRSELLLEDRFVAVVRRGHPAAGAALVPETLAQTPHLVISSSGDNVDFIAAELAERDLVRHVAAEAPYLSAGPILLQSDMLAVVGRRIAEEFRRAFPIEILELPFASPPVSARLVWHSRFDDDDGHKWLRKLIASALL